MSCVVRLLRANRSSKGVLPTVMCHCVCSRNLKNEAALARVGLLRQGNKQVQNFSFTIYNAPIPKGK